MVPMVDKPGSGVRFQHKRHVPHAARSCSHWAIIAMDRLLNRKMMLSQNTNDPAGRSAGEKLCVSLVKLMEVGAPNTAYCLCFIY